MLYEPAELLKAVNAMAEAETTKQKFFEEMVISSTRPRRVRLVIVAGLKEIGIPGRRFRRQEWRQASHGLKQRPRAARPGYDRHDWDYDNQERERAESSQI